ncbi:MAG: ROK family protein, partial [Rhodothermales bacterium]|nr:ROK family protein [Rhodothermales bacterium]
MLTGTNLKYAKAHNQRIVLETVRLFGPIARKEIAARTELTLQSVSNITRALLKAELIMEADQLRGGRGAPTSLLALNPTGAFSFGLDFDREHFLGVLVDQSGTVRRRTARDVYYLMPDEAIELMAGTVVELMNTDGIDKARVWGVGIGLPGPLGKTRDSAVTNVVNPFAFPGWTSVPIVDALRERLDMPVYIENNALAAAVGERWYGRGQHIADFFYLYFGIGLGGGLVLNGRPYDGHRGNAGEIGAAPTGLRADFNSDSDYLGAYFSVANLSKRLEPHGVKISRPDEIGPLFDAGHADVIDWLNAGVRELAPFILAIEYLLDPDAIFLGGRYSDSVIEYIRERLDSILPNLRKEDRLAYPRLLCGTAGEEATALGAATLPMYSFMAPSPDVLLKNKEIESLSSRI